MSVYSDEDMVFYGWKFFPNFSKIIFYTSDGAPIQTSLHGNLFVLCLIIPMINGIPCNGTSIW